MADVERVRSLVCRHTDGVAIGSTMAALAERGGLDRLAAAERIRFADLRRDLDANAGYLHVAVKLLANQGWLVFRDSPDPDRLVLEPTPPGRAVFAGPGHAYGDAAAFLPAAQGIEALVTGASSDEAEAFTAAIGQLRRGWSLPTRDVPPDVRKQVQTHLDGHVVAPLMLALTGRGLLRAGVDIPLDDPVLRQAVSVLAWQGWAQTNGNTAWLTPDGEIAVAFARQYRYPLVYLPLLRRVPQLLFGDAPAETGVDAHLDRGLDVRFSGDVFNAVCRRPFLAMSLPLFTGLALDEQPTAVVDTGCGDATALIALYSAVRANTERGRSFARAPLTMVGVDPSPVARRIASARMTAAGVPHVVMDGDIADPAGLARELGRHGIDATRALHICKSAIHDRAFRETVTPDDEPPPVSYAAYALPDGAWVSAADIATSLADLLREWRTLTRRFGWIVMEGHSTPAAVAARLVGGTVASSLDSTHGYSCQYPVEPRVYDWAVRSAGFRRHRRAAPGAAKLGHVTLTIDHLVVERGARSA